MKIDSLYYSDYYSHNVSDNVNSNHPRLYIVKLTCTICIEFPMEPPTQPTEITHSHFDSHDPVCNE